MGVTHRCAFARFYKKWGKGFSGLLDCKELVVVIIGDGKADKRICFLIHHSY